MTTRSFERVIPVQRIKRSYIKNETKEGHIPV